MRYVLLTSSETYFKEYLLGHLILCTSITDAMIFKELDVAIKFKNMLFEHCQLICSVNTYIE